MADEKISELPANADLADTDICVLVDDMGGTPTTKYITGANLKAAILAYLAGETVTIKNLIIDDAGNIGSASDTDAIAIAAAGILTFSGQSSAKAYIGTEQKVPNATLVPPILDTESWDIQNEFDSTVVRDTAEAGTAGTTLHCDGIFAPADVGKFVWNTAAGDAGSDLGKSTTIASFTSVDEVELTADIGIDAGDTFAFGNCKFTTNTAGKYLIVATYRLETLDDGEWAQIYLYKNATLAFLARFSAGTSIYGQPLAVATIDLAATDTVWFYIYQDSGEEEISDGAGLSSLQVTKLT